MNYVVYVISRADRLNIECVQAVFFGIPVMQTPGQCGFSPQRGRRNGQCLRGGGGWCPLGFFLVDSVSIATCGAPASCTCTSSSNDTARHSPGISVSLHQLCLHVPACSGKRHNLLRSFESASRTEPSIPEYSLPAAFGHPPCLQAC